MIVDSGCLPFLSTFDGVRDRLYYTAVGNPGMDWYVRDRATSNDSRLSPTDDLASRLREEVLCITVIDRPQVIRDLREAVTGRYGGSLTVRGFANEYFPGWDWMTVHDGNARKDRALRWLLREAGLDTSEVVALGDSDSDVPLLRFATRGIAVANAIPEVLAVAEKTIGRNTADSVIEFIERDWDGGDGT